MAFDRIKQVCLRTWPLLALLALALLFGARLVFTAANAEMQGVDIELYFRYLHQYAKEEVLAGRIPLWTPYVYAGCPFAANPQCTVFYPPAWLVHLIPVPLAQKWMVFIHILGAGAFMYLLARRCGLPPASCLITAMPWMFGSYVMANLVAGHIPMLFTMAWIPLIVLLYERAVERGKWVGFLWPGAAMGMQVLAGEMQNCYYTVLLIALHVLVRNTYCVRLREWRPALPARWLGHMAIIGIAAAGMSAVQWVLTAELASQSDRAGNTYEFATFMSLPPPSLLGLVVPWSAKFTDIGLGAAPPFPSIMLAWEWACYVGILTLVLAGFAIRTTGHPLIRTAKWTFVLSLVLVLGSYTPVYAVLLKVLPGLRLFRIPGRAVVLMTWSLCLLAGFGSHTLQKYFLLLKVERRSLVVPLALLTLGVALWVYVYFAPLHYLADETYWPVLQTSGLHRAWSALALPSVMSTLFAGVVLLAARWDVRRAPLLLVLGLGIDLYRAHPGIPLVTHERSSDNNLELLGQVKQRLDTLGQPARIDFSPYAVAANAGLLARVENVNGYWPLSLGRFYRFVHAAHGVPVDPRQRHQLHAPLYDQPYPSSMGLLNVAFWGARNEATRKVRAGSAPRTLPRAWLVDRVEVIPGDDAALARVVSPEFDAGRSVVLEEPSGGNISPGRNEPGTCVTSVEPDGSMAVNVQAAKPAYLVMSSLHYPGWQATIDGAIAPLLRANYILCAIAVPEGEHRVELRYRPMSFRLGAVVSVASVSALGLIGLIQARKRKQKPAQTAR